MKAKGHDDGNPIKYALEVHHQILEGFRDEIVTLEMPKGNAEILDAGAAMLAEASGVPLEAARAALIELLIDEWLKTHPPKSPDR